MESSLQDPPVHILIDQPSDWPDMVTQPDEWRVEFRNPARTIRMGRFEPVPKTGTNCYRGHDQVNQQVNANANGQLPQVLSEPDRPWAFVRSCCGFVHIRQDTDARGLCPTTGVLTVPRACNPHRKVRTGARQIECCLTFRSLRSRCSHPGKPGGEPDAEFRGLGSWPVVIPPGQARRKSRLGEIVRCVGFRWA